MSKSYVCMQVSYCRFPHWFLNTSRVAQKASFVPQSLTKAFMDQTEEEAAGVSTENSFFGTCRGYSERLEKRYLEEIKVVLPLNNKS